LKNLLAAPKGECHGDLLVLKLVANQPDGQSFYFKKIAWLDLNRRKIGVFW
jgi:hypothetical protein